MARLATEFWIQAYFARLQQAGLAAYVVARGDSTAGAVLIKANTLDGRARLYQRRLDLFTGAASWMELAAGPESEVDETIAKQRSFDPDLWVVEVEDRHGRTLLDQPGLD